MSRSLTGQVNLRELARQEASIEAELPLSDFERVVALSTPCDNKVGESEESVIRVSLRFSENHELVFLRGDLEGSVNLTCQRCMEVMEYSLAGPVKLAVSETEREVEGLPKGFELVCLLDTDDLGLELEEVHLMPLVEDELLLRIPLVPMHGEGAECSGRARIGEVSDEADPKENITRPFSALADLMASKGKGH